MIIISVDKRRIRWDKKKVEIEKMEMEMKTQVFMYIEVGWLLTFFKDVWYKVYLYASDAGERWVKFSSLG